MNREAEVWPGLCTISSSESPTHKAPSPIEAITPVDFYGTGLGLAVVWNTVQDHNGYINVNIYSKHLSAIISRSGLAEPDISNIKSKLETLIQSNRRHKNVLTSLVQQIKGESIDVY